MPVEARAREARRPTAAAAPLLRNIGVSPFVFFYGWVDAKSFFFHFLAVEDSVLSNGGSETIRDELNYKVYQKDSRTDTASDEPLVNIKTIITNFKHYSSELGNDDLETDNQEPDEEEDKVIS